MARDHQGLVLLSMGRRIERCTSVEEAEGMAALHGLRELMKFYTGPIELEMDCLSLARALAPGEANQSCLFPIIADIRSLLDGFTSYRIGWIKRERNRLAHCLAFRAKTTGDFFQMASVPEDLNEIWKNDCNLVD